MNIDSHHHLWKYSPQEYGWISEEMGVLRRDFWLDELNRVSKENGIDGFVTVQARQSIVETNVLLELAETDPLIRGVVGWVDFRSDEAEAQLEKYADNRWLKGLRHVVQDEPDDRFIMGEAFNRGIEKLNGRDLVYDVLIFAKQLPASIEFVRQHAHIPMVLDHIAKPTITSRGVDPQWKAQMEEIAKFPNLCCKFSGVATEVTEDAWDVDLIRPYWDIVLENFSPTRMMFGSDWPVCLLKTQYDRWLHAVQQLASELGPDERAEIFGGTAQRVYQLE